MDYINEGRNVIIREAEGLKEIADKLDSNFENAVRILNGCKGRVIVIGVGKSGIIGRKIASTLASTGTPAFFLHPTDAIHGELGMVTNDDVVILISNSGETNEIISILPNIKLLDIQTIGLIGKVESTLWKYCDIKLNTGVSSEADPNNLAPTTSTSAALAMGDALAIVLLKLKQFQPEDFAKLHPGGALGKKLTTRVEDLMYKGDKVPKVSKNALIKEVMFIFTKIGLGIAAIVDNNDTLLGVFTDGDLRRLIEKQTDFLNIRISNVMKTDPKTISKDELAFDALKMMKDYKITALIVTNSNNKVIGVINIHDILKAGIT